MKLVKLLHPSWSFYAALVGIIVGVTGSLIFRCDFNLHFIWLILAGILLGLALWRANYCTIVLAFLAGLIFAHFRIQPMFAAKNYLANFSHTEITIIGKLSDYPVVKENVTVIKLKNLEKLPDLSLYIQLAGTNFELERSDQITLRGKLSDGFGTFAGSLYHPEVLAIERPSPGDLFAEFATNFSATVRQFISSPAVDLGLGYLLGDKSGLSSDFTAALQMVGMTHVVVASGAHLAIITGMIRKLFGKISKFAGLLFGLLAILGFALIVGFTPSMMRAGLVAALSLIMGYVGREFTPGRLLTFVAALTLLISPSNFLSLGWQLSFASFFGILLLAPQLTRLFYGGKNPPWLANMLLTSLATTLACAPILIYNFGTISLLSFVANLIILPTLPIAMLLCFMTGVTSFWPVIAQLVAKLATLLLDLHIWLIEFLSDKTTFILQFSPGNPLVFLLFVPVVAFTAKMCYNEKYDQRKRECHHCRN